MSGVKNTALFERLMEIHSNSPKLYYGFNCKLCVLFEFIQTEICLIVKCLLSPVCVL